MTLRIPAKVLLHVWSYDFYDMTLSTGKQRRHMIKPNVGYICAIKLFYSILFSCSPLAVAAVKYPELSNHCLLG